LRGTPPLAPDVIASSHPVSTTAGLALHIEAVVRNSTPQTLEVAASSQCPLALALLPDPNGDYPTSLVASQACPFGESVALAPGDSTVLTRTVPADSLTSQGAGTYSLTVIITTRRLLIGVWGGQVQLPLTLTP